MAQAGGIRAGKAFVEIFADDNPLVKGLRQAEQHLKQWGATVRDAGIKMAAVGGAILAPLYKGAMAFGDFDEQMRQVSTQLKNPQEWMGAYSAGIRKLAVDFGEGTDTLSKGLYDILSASFEPAKAMDMLAVSVKAARGGMTDTATAVDGLTSVLNSYQLGAEDASRVSDIMFASVLRGKMEFPDLAANIGKIAPTARAAGMSIEDMMGSLATMTRQGIKAEESAVRLGNILSQAPEWSGDILGLAKKFEGASLPEIQLRFPERRAAQGIAALSGDIKGLTEDLELMRNSSGASEEAFKKMTGGLGMSFRQAKASVNDLFIAMGSALAPALIDAISWFRKAVKSTGDWISQNKGAVLLALKLSAGLLGIGAASVALEVGLRLLAVPLGILRGGFSLLGTGLSLVLGPFKLFGLFLQALPFIIVAVLHPITALFSVVRGSVLSFAGTFKAAALSISFLLNPLTLVIAGLAALTVAGITAEGFFGRALKNLGRFFGQFKNDAIAAFNGIAEALKSGDIELAAKILWGAVELEFKGGIIELKRAWLDFIESIPESIKDSFGAIRDLYEYLYSLGVLLGRITHKAVDPAWEKEQKYKAAEENWLPAGGKNKPGVEGPERRASVEEKLKADIEALAIERKKFEDIVKSAGKQQGAAGIGGDPLDPRTWATPGAGKTGKTSAIPAIDKAAMIFEPIVEAYERGSRAIEAALQLTRRTAEDTLSATEEKLRSATDAWKKMREGAADAGLLIDKESDAWKKMSDAAKEAAIKANEGLDEQKRKVIALRQEVEALKQVEILRNAQKSIDTARQTSRLQGGGVNLQEGQRQTLLGAYNQMSGMPGFSEQSAEAQMLRASIEALQTPMQAFIGQLQSIPPLWQQIGTLMGDTLNTVTSGVGNMIAQALIYQQDIGTLGLALLRQIGAQVIATVIEIGIQQIVAALVGKVAFMAEVVGKMGGYAAMTYASVYAANAGIPIVGPFIAAGIASAAVGAMLIGAGVAKGLGSAAGLAMGYDKGGISLSPQLAAVSERGHPELHLTRPNISRFFPELLGSGGSTTIVVELDGQPLLRHTARKLPGYLRLRGVAG